MLPRAVTRALVLSFLTLLPLAACSSSTANPVPPPAEAGSDAGMAETEAAACSLEGLTLVGPQTPKVTAACSACLSSMCCKSGQACAATADCAALARCVAACPTAAGPCATGCEAMHPTGVTAGRPFVDCELSTCDLACQSFDCVGTVKWPAPKTPTVTFKFRPTDFETNKPLVGATVKVCALTDTACAMPSETYETDSTGVATVTAPSAAGGIKGYLEVSATSYMTTLDFLALPAGNATLDVSGVVIGGVVLTTSIWTTLTKAVNITPDPTRGYLTFVADDCAVSPAAGVKVSVSTEDAKTKAVYIEGVLPSATATATDSSGEGGLINVPPGPATLTGTDATGTKFSTQSVVFRAGAITLAGVIVTR